jgi:hypothetical protein
MALTDEGDLQVPDPLPPAAFDARRRHFMTMIAEQRAVREPRIHRRRSLAAMTAALALVATSAVVGIQVISSDPDLGSKAFAIAEEPSGTVAVQIVSTQASAEQMTRQLHAAGLKNVSVETISASPALVGIWASPGGEGAQAVSDQLAGYTATVEIPRSLSEPLTLTVGRAPKPGERINLSGFRNQLAPGGPLACLGVPGAKPADAVQRLVAAGYTIDFWYTSNREQSLPATTAVNDTLRVVGVYNDDLDLHDHWRLIPGREHSVSVQVAPANSSLYDETIWTGFAPSLRTGDPATAGC